MATKTTIHSIVSGQPIVDLASNSIEAINAHVESGAITNDGYGYLYFGNEQKPGKKWSQDAKDIKARNCAAYTAAGMVWCPQGKGGLKAKGAKAPKASTPAPLAPLAGAVKEYKGIAAPLAPLADAAPPLAPLDLSRDVPSSMLGKVQNVADAIELARTFIGTGKGGHFRYKAALKEATGGIYSGSEWKAYWDAAKVLEADGEAPAIEAPAIEEPKVKTRQANVTTLGHHRATMPDHAWNVLSFETRAAILSDLARDGQGLLVVHNDQSVTPYSLMDAAKR